MKKFINKILGDDSAPSEEDRKVASWMYFRRAKRFDLEDGEVVIKDINAEKEIRMDKWSEVIFLSADGSMMVRQFVKKLESDFPENERPDNLNQSIIEAVLTLQKEGILELAEKEEPLPYYFAIPVSEQDKAVARQAMIDNGYFELGGEAE